MMKVVFYILLVFGLTGILIFHGCVPPHRPASPKPTEVKPSTKLHNNFLGTMESIMVNDAPLDRDRIPEEPKTVKIIVKIDTNEIPKFKNIRKFAHFKIRSMRRTPYLTVRLTEKHKEKENELRFEMIREGYEANGSYEGRISEVRRCLQMWAEGEKCLLEFFEPERLKKQTSPSTTGS